MTGEVEVEVEVDETPEMDGEIDLSVAPPLVPSSCVQVTGIPPHVSLMASMASLMRQQKTSIKEMTDTIVKELEDLTMGGTLSETRLRAMLM